ncbi:hypothetical protein BaRGS_00031624 [Batillaria attramentaria]|uniref:Major facilitator superfamily (MFS) profile domain-containing protein n=1 Tax=Batillaria attramentaria TaxID=370345 RepID=A0ABD0JQM1_9CAEN
MDDKQTKMAREERRGRETPDSSRTNTAKTQPSDVGERISHAETFKPKPKGRKDTGMLKSRVTRRKDTEMTPGSPRKWRKDTETPSSSSKGRKDTEILDSGHRERGWAEMTNEESNKRLRSNGKRELRRRNGRQRTKTFEPKNRNIYRTRAPDSRWKGLLEIYTKNREFGNQLDTTPGATKKGSGRRRGNMQYVRRRKMHRATPGVTPSQIETPTSHDSSILSEDEARGWPEREGSFGFKTKPYQQGNAPEDSTRHQPRTHLQQPSTGHRPPSSHLQPSTSHSQPSSHLQPSPSHSQPGTLTPYAASQDNDTKDRGKIRCSVRVDPRTGQLYGYCERIQLSGNMAAWSSADKTGKASCTHIPSPIGIAESILARRLEKTVSLAKHPREDSSLKKGINAALVPALARSSGKTPQAPHSTDGIVLLGASEDSIHFQAPFRNQYQMKIGGRRKRPLERKYITIFACLLIEFTLGVVFTSGNSIPYLASYIRNVTGDASVGYTDALWIDDCMWIATVTSMPLLGLLQLRLPIRLFLLIGFVSFAASLVANYWALQTSFTLVVMVYGAGQGLAQAIIWPACLCIALQWTGKRKGLVGGVVMAGYGGGALVINQIITFWVNPSNKHPDMCIEDEEYFTQPEILQKVPSVYLILGAVLSVIQLVSFLAVVFPDTKRETPKTTLVAPAPLDNRISTIPKSVSQHAKEDKIRRSTPYTGHLSSRPNAALPTYGNSPLSSDVDIMVYDLVYQPGLPFYCELLQGKRAYGQTFVSEDLIALAGSSAHLLGGLARPFWGTLADRYGLQPVMALNLGILAVSSALFSASEHVGAALFFVCICLMFFSFNGVFACHGPLIFCLFGSRYFVFSMGITHTSIIISCLTSVHIARAVKNVFGWHGIFLVAAGAEFVATLTTFPLAIYRPRVKDDTLSG